MKLSVVLWLPFLMVWKRMYVLSAPLETHRIIPVQNGDYSEVDRYLEKYGYMTKSLTTHTTSERDNSLRAFQNFNNLKETGKLDNATIALMNRPRCGLPDMGPRRNRQTRSYTGYKWNKKTLTWMIKSDGYTNDLFQSVQRSEMARALKAWSDVSGLEFSEVSSDPDILIYFAYGDHGDEYPFGAGAHAFYPDDGDVHFSDSFTWVVNKTGYDLFMVATHEFGHSVGLVHSYTPGSVMAPYYNGYDPNFKLHDEDISTIQTFYAHAYYPDADYPDNGDVHFSDSYTWVVNQTGVDLFYLAAHEFGHSLGLDHSYTKSSVMYPYYYEYIPDYKLHDDDVQNIQALYGVPSPWTKHGNKEYRLFEERLTWNDAQTFCGSNGGHLAHAGTASKNDFLISLTDKLSFAWLGGSDIQKEGDWKWVNPEVPMTFTYWSPRGSQPNNGLSANCLTFWYSNCCGYPEPYLYIWADVPCDYKNKFICERSPGV